VGAADIVSKDNSHKALRIVSFLSLMKCGFAALVPRIRRISAAFAASMRRFCGTFAATFLLLCGTFDRVDRIFTTFRFFDDAITHV